MPSRWLSNDFSSADDIAFFSFFFLKSSNTIGVEEKGAKWRRVRKTPKKKRGRNSISNSNEVSVCVCLCVCVGRRQSFPSTSAIEGQTATAVIFLSLLYSSSSIFFYSALVGVNKRKKSPSQDCRVFRRHSSVLLLQPQMDVALAVAIYFCCSNHLNCIFRGALSLITTTVATATEQNETR